jgi:hypothetical protein
MIGQEADDELGVILGGCDGGRAPRSYRIGIVGFHHISPVVSYYFGGTVPQKICAPAQNFLTLRIFGGFIQGCSDRMNLKPGYNRRDGVQSRTI